MAGYVEGKDKNEILADLVSVASVGSKVHEQQKMAIVVRCTEDLESALGSLDDSMCKSAASNDTLSRRVLVLNIVLGVATLVGAGFAIAQFLRALG